MSLDSPTSRQESFLNEDKSLACIHCGLCLSSCPTYLETGNENDSPRGRIYQMRALQNGDLPLEEETVRHLDLCLGCRACETACPSGVEYGSLLESTREHIDKNFRRSLPEMFLRRFLIEGIFPYSRRVAFALKPAVVFNRLGLTSVLPASLRRFIDLVPERMSPRRSLPIFSASTTEVKLGSVGFLSGCVMDVMFNETNWNSIRLLNLAGYDVFTPLHQSCCGALHAHSGALETARKFGSSLMDRFEIKDLDYVIINAAGCGSTVKEYGHLFATDSGGSSRATEFGSKVLDLSEALERSPAFIDLLARTKALTSPSGIVTFHDACHLAHAQRITDSPRVLVKALAGDNFVELPESDVCCGSAGSYNLTEPEMAERLRSRKIGNIRKSGSTVVVSTNPGCLLQIASGLKRSNGDATEILHLADYIARSIP